jgi:hypothetical protein
VRRASPSREAAVRRCAAKRSDGKREQRPSLGESKTFSSDRTIDARASTRQRSPSPRLAARCGTATIAPAAARRRRRASASGPRRRRGCWGGRNETPVRDLTIARSKSPHGRTPTPREGTTSRGTRTRRRVHPEG